MSNFRSPRSRLSRRNVLRGAGVALALPWLESLQFGEAKAQSQNQLTRFLPIFLPNGAPELWKPLQVGRGASWGLSSVLQPLETLKTSVSVLSGLENGSVFNADGSSSVEPAHGRQPGAWLTCVDSVAVRQRLGVNEANGISVDQLIAAHVGGTPISSLQLGLSTVESSCDGQPCSLSRSVSWRDELTPLYKAIDPLAVFNQLVSVLGPDQDSEEAKRRLAARSSVLDAVKASAGVVRPKLSSYDQRRLDEYLDSVRSLEQRVTMIGQTNECPRPSQPVFADLSQPGAYSQTTALYDKGTHADLMNDLIVMAFQCNLTRVISYMLEDEHSQYVYDHVPKRTFTAQGSIASTGTCGEYSGAQHGSGDDYATITWWNVGKVAQLCQKLAAITEADGRSVLDNSVVFLGCCMHGTDHRCSDLPSLLIGSGGGLLRTDQHVDLGNRPLRDLYFTLMNHVFDLGVLDFGTNATGAPLKPIIELLA